MRSFFFCVAAHRCAGAAAYLGYSDGKSLFTYLFPLSCGNYHSGVRYGYSDAGDYLFKKLIAYAVVKCARVYIVGALDTRYTDGVRSYSVYGFKMLCVHQQTCKFIFVHLKAE